MLPFSPAPAILQPSKCFFSYGTMGHLNPDQPPATERTPIGSGQKSKLKKPWSGFQELGYVHQVDLVLPQEHADAVCQKLVAEREAPRYTRVVMTLGQILTGAFFTDYIKTGSVWMLSRGHAGKDNVLSLQDGLLVMFVDRESFERAGLAGRPHGAKGNRGLRSRWVIEIDLNAPSMCPGKNGYDRLLYACKNVFHEPLTWLFYNAMDTPSPDPLAQLSVPVKVCTASPAITANIDAVLPPLGRPASLLTSGEDSDAMLESEEVAVELYEWLALVRLDSPRILAGDTIDNYLSRYRVPGTALEGDTKETLAAAAAGTHDQQVCVVRWRGFLSPSWVCQTLLDTLFALPSSSPSSPWFALSASGFPRSKNLANEGGPECTFFRPSQASGDYLFWNVHSHE